jgi:thiamine pyrophosphate-dependent acetolactate synthase large subunit-like protein
MNANLNEVHTVRKTTRRVSEVIMSEIKRRGVKRVFGVPGRENAHILFNEAPGLQYLTTRVELTAGIAADFAGRVTRKPQVCFSTMGPGATNMTTAVASAMLNCSPLIFISAQLESNDLHYNVTHQCVDQARVMEPLTKWSYQVKNAEEVPAALDAAFRIAMTEPLGPVHLAIPTDFFARQIEVEHVPERAVEPKISLPSVEANEESIEMAHRELMAARHPLCLVGEGAIRVGAGPAVADFCKRWNMPVVTAANAKGLLPHDHPLNYGAASPYMEGILGYQALADIYTDVDLLVCVGYQYVDDLLPKMWAYGAEKRIVSIRSTPTLEIWDKFRPNVECSGSIPRTLGKLVEAGVQSKPSRAMDHLREVYRRAIERQENGSGILTPVQVVDTVNRHLGDGILCTDIGYYRHHAILFSRPEKTGQFFTDTGLSSFGSGLPSAIGVQAEHLDKSVFLVCGDGGFHSGSGDLETLVRYQLPCVVIVMNNRAFQLIKLYQRKGSPAGNDAVVNLGPVDFVKLAEANGCAAVRASTVSELEAAITGRDKTRPLVIEVPMEYRDADSFRESF